MLAHRPLPRSVPSGEAGIVRIFPSIKRGLRGVFLFLFPDINLVNKYRNGEMLNQVQHDND